MMSTSGAEARSSKLGFATKPSFELLASKNIPLFNSSVVDVIELIVIELKVAHKFISSNNKAVSHIMRRLYICSIACLEVDFKSSIVG